MSDEHQRRSGGSEPDRTQQFDPYAGDEVQPDGGPRSGDARTEPMPRTGDETVLNPRPDATSVMPAATEGSNPAWSGRAEVRPPRPPQRDFPSGGWDVVPPPPREPRGKWWSPIVIGIVVLILLALLGWGLWLIVQNSGDDSPTTPAATTSAAAPATTDATSAATTEPTTQPATTEPTGPEEVTIPALQGLSSSEARQALDRKGLSYRLRFVTSGDAPAGTVIDSDPAEGQQVPPDTTVTLIIAAAPSSSPSVSATPSSSAPTDTTGD